jgi:hypothetical protein
MRFTSLFPADIARARDPRDIPYPGTDEKEKKIS